MGIPIGHIQVSMARGGMEHIDSPCRISQWSGMFIIQLLPILEKEWHLGDKTVPNDRKFPKLLFFVMEKGNNSFFFHPLQHGHIASEIIIPHEQQHAYL